MCTYCVHTNINTKKWTSRICENELGPYATGSPVTQPRDASRGRVILYHPGHVWVSRLRNWLCQWGIPLLHSNLNRDNGDFSINGFRRSLFSEQPTARAVVQPGGNVGIFYLVLPPSFRGNIWRNSEVSMLSWVFTMPIGILSTHMDLGYLFTMFLLMARSMFVGW